MDGIAVRLIYSRKSKRLHLVMADMEDRNTLYATSLHVQLWNDRVSCVRSSNSYRLHRVLMGVEGKRTGPDGKAIVVDHINLNPCDNRRANLRIATVRGNCTNVGLKRTNTSGYKGVCMVHYTRGLPFWRAFVRTPSGRISKTFKDKVSAHFWACDMREKYHGDYVRHF